MTAWGKVVIVCTVIMATCAVVVSVQVTRRNSQLDKLEDQGDRIEKSVGDLNKTVGELQTSSARIKEIAEKFAKGDPQQAAALEELFRKIDAIYEAVVTDAGR